MFGRSIRLVALIKIDLLQAEIKVKIAGPKKEAKPKMPNVTSLAKGDTKSNAGSSQPKPVKRPATSKFQEINYRKHLMINVSDHVKVNK